MSVDDHPYRISRPWLREAGGALAAVLIALVVVSHVASSGRAALLYDDGDSLVNALLAHSVAIGQPQHWAMSPVLFIPEAVVFGLLSLIAPLKAALTLNAVVNLLALYGALRLVSGARRHAAAPVLGAVLAFAAFALLALLENSPGREALELASLLSTTTYYSATVIGALVTIGIVRRALDGPEARPWSRGILLLLVSAVSTLSNPLYLVWAVAPVGVALVVLALAGRAPWALVLRTGAALVAGLGIGLGARALLRDLIVAESSQYVQPGQWAASASYYGELLAERWASPGGAAAILLTAALLIGAVVLTVLRWRRDAPVLVPLLAWFAPVAVLVGAVALGTHASRYLEPFAFMPVLVLVLVPLRLPRLVAPIALAALLVPAVAGIPRLVEAQRIDPAIACVTDWVEHAGRVGAGQFWSVRAPKAYLDDPRLLVQVDDHLAPYEWLVNRDDFTAGPVTFLVTDDQSPPFVLAPELEGAPTTQVRCGGYTITDYGQTELPLGP